MSKAILGPFNETDARIIIADLTNAIQSNDPMQIMAAMSRNTISWTQPPIPATDVYIDLTGKYQQLILEAMKRLY